MISYVIEIYVFIYLHHNNQASEDGHFSEWLMKSAHHFRITINSLLELSPCVMCCIVCFRRDICCSVSWGLPFMVRYRYRLPRVTRGSPASQWPTSTTTKWATSMMAARRNLTHLPSPSLMAPLKCSPCRGMGDEETSVFPLLILRYFTADWYIPVLHCRPIVQHSDSWPQSFSLLCNYKWLALYTRLWLIQVYCLPLYR